MTRMSVLLVLSSLALAGCSRGMDDLMVYIDEVKARPGGRIEPLPQIQPYETFSYSAGQLRSPFQPDRPQARGPAAGPRPDATRPREYLEQFPLDTLKMAGTVTLGGQTYGLLQTSDGLIHRVLPGQYVGQNEGRITGIGEAGISVEELVADGMGGFFRRPAAIGVRE
ncbi:MAG: pilus assembly protein PilP [Chromatiales bacterium]|nr:pilus assembly protein PilP [Chromatiales bacterium]